VSDREAPIPSVAAALATLLGVFAIGRRLSGAHTGFIALVVLATSPGFFFLSHEVLPDMMFAAWLTWALYFLLRALGALPPRPCHLVGFYLCVVGALWTKGLPAMMVIPATIAACLASGGGRTLLGLRPWMGLGLVALAALPWALPYALTPEHASSQALGASHAVIWYFDRYRRQASIPVVDSLVEFLPWALWLIPVAVWWRLSSDRRAYRPVLAWMLVFAVLVGLSGQQRARYLLPVYPALALMVAAAVTAGACRARAMIRINAAILVAVLSAALPAAGWLLLAKPPMSWTPIAAFVPTSVWERVLLGALGIGGPAVALWDMRIRRSPSRALGWVAGALAVVLLWEATTYAARAEAAYPIRAFADRVRPSLDRAAPLVAYPDASLAFDLYLDHPIEEVITRETIARRLLNPAAGGLLLREADWSGLHGATHPSWCSIDRVSMGSRSFVLVRACR